MDINVLTTIDKDITLLLDNLPVGIIRLNKNKECIYANKFIYDFFNIRRTDNISIGITLPHEIFRRVHPEDLEKFDDLEFDKETEKIFRIWKTDIRDWVWINSKKILIQNEDSQITYMYTFEDINSTKTLEIQLRNERLKVEQAYNHKSIFLANMSHEIRTPIHGIVGMLTLLEDTKLTSEQIDYIGMIKECSFNLMAIINDILDYSKLEIGKISIENKPINIQRCIESVNDIIVSRIIGKPINYSYNINVDTPTWISGDCNRLKQIILNLVSNSIKFTESGNIMVNIEQITKKDYILLKRLSKYETDENDIQEPDDTIYIRFDITDTGCGIDITEKDKLFKSFSQVDNKITDKIYPGTGLGLAICKQLIELMGGYIWLDWSEPKGGSRFSFVIKTKISQEIDQDSIENESIDDSILTDLKVLILDDNVHNRIGLSGMVNKWGMKAYSFSTVEEALYFTKITHFDLGLVDICMPKSDGPSFARRLREFENSNSQKELPLIALSSLGEHLDTETGNFFIYQLSKPIKENRLKQKCIEIANNIQNSETISETTVIINDNIVDSKLGDHLRSSICILLAEDIYINQKVIVSFLNKLGFSKIDVVENGIQCLDMLKTNEYDIILLDIRMPLLSGDAVLKELVDYYNDKSTINKKNKFKNISKPYTIAVTAYCLKDDKNKYLSMGFDDYLPKPININDLEKCLNKYVKNYLE